MKLRKDDFLFGGGVQLEDRWPPHVQSTSLVFFVFTHTRTQTQTHTLTGHLKNAVDFLLPPRLEPDSDQQECQFHCQSNQ